MTKYLEVRDTHQTLQTALDYVGSFYSGREKYICDVCPNDSLAPVGTMLLSDTDRFSGSAAVGLMIGEKEYWGKGG